jgi:colanic acid biosynthesis glycosyl transferase WcaI
MGGRLRVLVWGVNYHPEKVGIAPYNTALCEYLRGQGHDVEMVTTFPYYPMWRKAAEDRGCVYRTDVVRGVPVHRCWHFVPGKPSWLGRMVHEASFVVSSTMRALMLKRADVMVVVSPPLLIGAAAWLVGRLKGTPHVLHIQDLQPDAAVGLGMLEHGSLIKMLRVLERFNYRTAARVSVISQGMAEALKGRGIEEVVYFPNWIGKNGAKPERGVFRARRGIGVEEFVLLYSGNIGMKQGLDLMVEAAARVKEVRLIICGDGAGRRVLEELVVAREAENVTLLPLQPEEDYKRMMMDADVCVISQRAGGGVAFFPSKLLSSAALGKPVLVVAEGRSELARVVRDEGLGVCVEPTGIEEVAEAIRGLRANKAGLQACGGNGGRFAERFEAGRVLGEFEGVLRGIANC